MIYLLVFVILISLLLRLVRVTHIPLRVQILRTRPETRERLVVGVMPKFPSAPLDSLEFGTCLFEVFEEGIRLTVRGDIDFRYPEYREQEMGM